MVYQYLSAKKRAKSLFLVCVYAIRGRGMYVFSPTLTEEIMEKFEERSTKNVQNEELQWEFPCEFRDLLLKQPELLRFYLDWAKERYDQEAAHGAKISDTLYMVAGTLMTIITLLSGFALLLEGTAKTVCIICIAYYLLIVACYILWLRPSAGFSKGMSPSKSASRDKLKYLHEHSGLNYPSGMMYYTELFEYNTRLARIKNVKKSARFRKALILAVIPLPVIAVLLFVGVF